MQTDYDLIICGAGPVGLTLAALLLRGGMDAKRLLLVDGKSLEASVADPRTVALSWGSRQILERARAWPVASDPIREIHVSRRGHFGRAMLRASEAGVPELGYVCRYGKVVQALDARIAEASVQVMRPLMAQASREHEDAVEIKLDNGLVLSAGVLVQAEGGLFHEQSARRQSRDYAQTAIISNVQATAIPPGRAYERFTDEGPLALLPQEGGYALVWCMPPEIAAQRMGLDEPEFLHALQQAFGQRVGRFTAAGPRHAFPLGLNVQEAQTRRSLAIGNAAQTLHPVAGQGLNLGLRDAAVLAQALAGQPGVEGLANYSRMRRADRQATVRMTDAMARFFTRRANGLQGLAGAGLGLLDALPPLKRGFAAQMMFGWR
jgi:2-octaprenyl-6-methoxyphenol hydroxylase